MNAYQQNQQIGQIAQPARIPAIPQTIQEINEALDRNLSVLQELEKRLSSVLAPSLPRPCEPPAGKDQRETVAFKLSKVAVIIREHTDCIAEMITRLEV